MVELSINPRLRESCYHEATVAAGLKKVSVYNHMLMPTSYGDPMAEYWRLINGVALWDVAVERQVELQGPDAGRLAAILTPRNLEKLVVGRGRYVPLCDHNGILINDPVLLKLADDRYWLSIADSDVLLWTRAIAAERGFDVQVFEPDVSPLAVQGPKAEDVVASLFGNGVRALKHFAFEETRLDNIPLVLARSGWSKQGGFELYLQDSTFGTDLWDRVMEAGRPWDIGPGSPNPIERIESGLVSYGSDTDETTNPLELGLGRLCDLEQETDFIGKAALRRIQEEGVRRRRVGFLIDGGDPGSGERRAAVTKDDENCGFIAVWTMSPRLGRPIGLGLIDTAIDDGSEVVLHLPKGPRRARVEPLPFDVPKPG